MKEASVTSGVPLRTSARYEKDNNYGVSLKSKTIMQLLQDEYEVTEENGILTIMQKKQ